MSPRSSIGRPLTYALDGGSFGVSDGGCANSVGVIARGVSMGGVRSETYIAVESDWLLRSMVIILSR